mgnify:FL=1
MNAILILDSENNILVNGSNLSDDKCKTILKEPSGNYKIVRYNLQYDGCSLVGILDKNLLFKSVYKIFFKEMLMILAAISIIAIALFIAAAKNCRTDSEIYCKITSDYRDKFQFVC